MQNEITELRNQVRTLKRIVCLVICFFILAGCSKKEDKRSVNVTNVINNYPFVAQSKYLPSDSVNYSFHSTQCSYCNEDIRFVKWEWDIGYNSYEEALSTGRIPATCCCEWDFVKHKVKEELPANVIDIQFDPYGNTRISHTGHGWHEAKDWISIDISYRNGTSERKWFKIKFVDATRGRKQWEVTSIDWKQTTKTD